MKEWVIMEEKKDAVKVPSPETVEMRYGFDGTMFDERDIFTCFHVGALRIPASIC